MAAITRHTYTETIGVMYHNARTLHHSPPNIDRTRSPDNYSVAPDHGGLSDREYLDRRLDQLWHLNRKDLNVTAEVVITQPQELPAGQSKAFFRSCERFLEHRYGRDNIISSFVHMDESQPHLHCMITPEGRNSHGACVSYEQVFGRKSGEFQRFHPDLQRWLDHGGFNVNVNSGITKRNGRAFSVKELKDGTYERYMNHKHAVEYQNTHSFDFSL